MEYRGGEPEDKAQLLGASRVGQGWLPHDLGSSSFFDDQHLLFLSFSSQCA